MKQAYLLLLALAPSFSMAQGLLTITDENGVAVTNGNVTYEMVNGELEGAVSLTTVLNGSTSMLVNVRRYEMNYQQGSENYFCWNECYSPVEGGTMPVWDSPDPKGLLSGTPFYGFHAYYRPNSSVGSSMYRYVWYAMADPNDSVYVDITFNATVTGIADNASLVNALKIFPNPSTGGDITINYELASNVAGTQLELYNVLGERKLVQPIGAAQGKVTLREADLNSGVWFAVLKRNGKTLTTKRVVVAR